MSEYIPYSIRHNITDPDLAGLLDYLEGETIWNIESYIPPSDNTDFYWLINCGGLSIHQHDGDIHLNIGNTRCFSDMPVKLFFRTYKTLLLVIRDLYSK